MDIEPLVSPDEFAHLEGIAHLCTGGEAPWLKRMDRVCAEFARLKSSGKKGREEIYARGERCREKVGRLWGVPADRIGFLPTASEGMNWLARGLDWKAGDNIVTTNLEFPPVAYAWRLLRERGVEVRLVPHREWRVSEDDLLEAVDGRTRVLAVSQVSFYTGQNLDLEKLAEGLEGRETLLAVDATHASGALQVPAGLTDLCVSSSYKWMLATHGVAPCYLSERAEEQIRSTSFGWRNLEVWPPQEAERFPDVAEKPMPLRLEPGNPAMLVVLLLEEAVDLLLDVGIERIEAHVRDLSERIGAGLEERGFTLISPSERSARSGNTCFLAGDAKGMEERLAERGVLVWGEFGRVRVSGHLYNGSDDADRLMEALDDLAHG